MRELEMNQSWTSTNDADDVIEPFILTYLFTVLLLTSR